MSRSKQIFIGAAAVTAITLSACGALPSIRIPGVGQIGGSSQGQTTTTDVATAKQVKVTLGSVENHIVATGQIAARQTAALAFTKSGVITKILVKEGDQVKAGQPVAVLDTSDLELTCDGITTIYGKRWNVEPYHKSLKQNASLSLSPTRTVTTQSNHLFASLCAYIKLEMLKVTTQTNHFALKSRLYLRALRTAFDTLRELSPVRLAA